MNNALSGRLWSLAEAVEYLENRVAPRIGGSRAVVIGLYQAERPEARGRGIERTWRRELGRNWAHPRICGRYRFT
jgi:hypothetical protein